MKFKGFFTSLFRFFNTHKKMCIVILIVFVIILAMIAAILLSASVKKNPVDTTSSDLVSKPTTLPVSSQETSSEEETVSEPDPPVKEIKYKNQVIKVPKVEVAKIDSKEDPTNSTDTRAAEQPAVQPKTSENIKTDCFDTVAYGIDVSSHQGNINWAKVKASGIEFAIIRCGYRGYESGKIVMDAKFEYNILNAYKNGIKVGAYFYSGAINTTEAVQEAAWVDQVLKNQQKKGIRIDYPVAYDFEEFGSHPTSRANGQSKEEVTDNAIAYLDYLDQAGYKVIHYCSKYSRYNRWDAERLNKYDFWLAHWCEATTYKGTYVIWQYSSQGKVNGISGNVDLDVSGIEATEGIGGASFAICEKDNVLAYSAPGSATVACTVKKDTIYDCLKTYAKDWSELYIDGKFVYVKNSDITTVEFTKSDTEYETADKISYYSKCIDQEANIVGTIEKDTKLQVIGIYNNLWLKVTYNNKTFYIKYSDVKESKKEGDPSQPPTDEEDTSSTENNFSSESGSGFTE